MTINFARLDDAITYAFEHPDEFDMNDWFRRTECGTTACLAGTVALQAGWEARFTPLGSLEWASTAAGVAAEPVVWRDGVGRAVSVLAAELLGLDTEQAEVLFIDSGDLAEVIEVRNRLAREVGVPERAWGTS